VAVVTAAVGWWRRRRRRRVTWDDLYDEPINQEQAAAGSPGIWQIKIPAKTRTLGPDDRGSQVILEVWNSGDTLEKEHWDAPLSFTFPDWEVVDFKVRPVHDADVLHGLIPRDPDTLPPNEPSTIVLPRIPFNRGARFRLTTASPI
jgi:hypothetical protein